jgi:hypothetical protein
MRDYSTGIAVESPVHREYLQWLNEHPLGLVLSMNLGRKGVYSVHRAGCGLLSYSLVAKGQRTRKGKICFESQQEFEAWCAAHDQIPADFNRCSRC